MEGATVQVDAHELVDVIRALEDRGRSVSELTPTLAEMLVSSVFDVFEAEGAVGGQARWADLAESTLRQRRGSGSVKILQDTAALVNSIEPGSSDTVAQAGSTSPYGGFHITGTRYMPKRDWLAIDFEALGSEISEFVLGELVR